MIDILVIALCTLLCAGETFNDMEDFGRAKQDWFKTFLGLRNGIPPHDTFNRVFAALDPKTFLDCFLRWTQSVRQAVPQEIVALDGKALRRALDIVEAGCKHVVGQRLKQSGMFWTEIGASAVLNLRCALLSAGGWNHVWALSSPQATSAV